MPLARANGTELFYDLTGPEGAPVVAFSNSIGTTLELWDTQVPALSDRYRLLRYDTRGHGRSPVAGGRTTMEDLADDLAGLLDALGVERAHVVGLSLGGMTAQAFAVRHPHRLEGRGLVLMGTSAHLPTGWDERAALVREKGMGAIVDAVLARWFTPPFLQQHPERVAPLRERFLDVDREGYALCCGAIRDMDLRDTNAAITARTLLIAGADDPATPPPMMEDIRARVPDAEMVVLSRAAHIMNVERPEAVNRYLAAFLDGFGASARGPEGASRITGGGGGASFEQGLANRRAVLGAEHVDRSLAGAGGFAAPWQDFITRTAWGEIWGDPALPWKTRSLVTLALMVALRQEEEFKLHVRPALKNGVTVPELRALLLQTAVYAGVPAANGAFRWAKEVLGDEAERA